MRVARFLRHEWLPVIATSVRPSTLAGYRLHVECHIVPRLGRLELSAIDARKLNALYASLLASGRVHGNGGLSPASVRRVHATVHRALKDAVRWGYLNENPADLCDPPKVRASDGYEMTTWTAEQLRAFLRSVKRDELYPLWFLLAATGMRRGEALGLRWSDVDLRAGRLSVRQTVVAVGAEILVSRPKTAKGRRAIALDKGTVAVLAAHKKRARPSSLEQLVYCGPDGSPLVPNWVSKRFVGLVDTSGLPRIRLHDLRHTHATLALQAGIHPKIVSERLGHATVAITLDVYSHATDHLQKEAAELVGKLISGR